MSTRQRFPEREQTDQSLRGEREKTDHALANRLEAVEEEADEVVKRARENADAVLEAARDKADRLLAAPSEAARRATLGSQRVQEDAALRGERAAADNALRLEREENARALAKLLPLERDRTDRYLLTERARSDVALSNRDDFLGMVTHDLRDLLRGIVMSTGLLATQASAGEEGDRTRAQTQRIQRYAARMNRLVCDLVDVASIEAGKLTIAPTCGDTALLIAEAVDTFHDAARVKGLPSGRDRAEAIAGRIRSWSAVTGLRELDSQCD